jgi:hypothetical protein
MTAQTMLPVPTRPEDEASLRPVPWRRMAWVIWRQHRIALGGAAAFLGGLAVLVWIVGLQLHHAYAAATACHPASSPVCSATVARFNGMNDFLANGFILQALPALIGAFVGAPILARELETSTFRYAWTQGLERWRWTLAKLATLGVVVTAAAGAFSVLNTWYFRPYFAAGNQALSLSTASPFASGLFDLRGVAFAAWTLAAFAIGGLAGMLIRRVVPAIIATLAAYAGLAFAAGALMRQHYLPPLLTSNPNVPGSAWILSQWGTKGGKHAWAGRVPPMNLLVPNCPPSGPPGVRVPKPSAGAILHCLPHHGAGYTLYTSYQPVSRFWSFQFIEGGWLLALSVLFIAVTVWLVRRRAA